MAVEHHLRATLGDVPELVYGDGQKVGGQRERLAVEVAGGVGEAAIAVVPLGPVLVELAVERIAFAGEKERIVGGGVELFLHDRTDESQRVARGAVDLRGA